MIEPYPRYAELLRRREQAGGERRRGQGVHGRRIFATCRSGTSWRGSTRSGWTRDARVRGLLAQGRGFTEDDKQVLREVELEILGRVVPEYARRGGARADRDRGVAVLPSDPAAAVRHATSTCARIRTRGCRGSGSGIRRTRGAARARRGVPRAALRPASRSGCGRRRARSPTPCPAGCAGRLPLDGDGRGDPGAHAEHRPDARRLRAPRAAGSALPALPIRTGGGEVACLFRDHVLSDLIGFTYASWDADGGGRRTSSAAWSRPGRRFSARTGGGEAVVPIILDGENAWEHYEGQGRPFLRALYGALADAPGTQDRHDERGRVQAPATPLQRRSSRARGSTATSTSGSATPTTTAPGASWPTRGRPSRRRDPSATADGIARAREELYIAEGLRLVLVVRRRPFVGPRPGVRRPVPAAPAQRLPQPRQAGARGAVPDQHHHRAAADDGPSAERVHRRRPSTAR